MRFVTFELEGKARPGVITGEDVVDLGEDGYGSLLDVIEAIVQQGVDASKFLPSTRSHSLSTVRLLAPIPTPRKFICVGLNYLDHAKESGAEIPNVPTIFNKFATTVIGPGQPIVLPKVSNSPDYEGEFAVIIGRGG